MITDTPNKTGSAIVQTSDIGMESAAIIAIAAAVAVVVKAAIDIPAINLVFLEERLFNSYLRPDFFQKRFEIYISYIFNINFLSGLAINLC